VAMVFPRIVVNGARCDDRGCRPGRDKDGIRLASCGHYNGWVARQVTRAQYLGDVLSSSARKTRR
jgi:hypothetical protein